MCVYGCSMPFIGSWKHITPRPPDSEVYAPRSNSGHTALHTHTLRGFCYYLNIEASHTYLNINASHTYLNINAFHSHLTIKASHTYLNIKASHTHLTVKASVHISISLHLIHISILIHLIQKSAVTGLTWWLGPSHVYIN